MRVAAASAREDAAITAAARRDPDNPPLTAADFAKMRPASEVVPQIVRRFRGLQKKPKKKLISLRLDPEVIAHFKRGGPGWQARINAKLREPLDSRRGAKRRAL
ncbi:MAG: BrnA antitoxin family protein [Xanthobacteraceae bacterium]